MDNIVYDGFNGMSGSHKTKVWTMAQCRGNSYNKYSLLNQESVLKKERG